MATIKLNEKEVIKFKKAYQKFKVESNNPHADETYKFTGCTITLFKTGKAFFQGVNAIKSAAKWGYKDGNSLIETFDEYCGSDEVGTGDFFGPIVVSACYANNSISSALKKMGVRDSKTINDRNILKLAPLILKATNCETIVLNNNEYNGIILNYNMNEIKSFMHNNALLKLNKKTNCDINVIDEFASLKNFNKYLINVENKIKKFALVQKAESKYIGVAAASIVARYSFLKEIKKLEKKYGIKIPLGANKRIDELIDKLDNSILVNIGKLNFKNYKNKR